MIGLTEITAARRRIAGSVLETPCRVSPRWSRATGAEVYFKDEGLQLTGSFKVRGSLNKILCLDAEERRHGVIAASAGNHAQGVASAASSHGIPSTIVMPKATPQIKVENTERYGLESGIKVEVELWGDNYDEAFAHALERQHVSHETFIHPFDDELVIAGQGTIGLEILEQVPDVEAVVVPIGGGGLISGIATAIRETRPEVKVYGVQTEAAPGMRLSLAQGEVITAPVSRSIAEGISVKRPGKITFGYVSKYVEAIELVSEDAIERAIVELLEREKTLTEGAAAAAAAALLGPLQPRLRGRKVVALLSGANIDLSRLNHLIERALARSQRLVRLRGTLQDRPGALGDFITVIGRQAGNILRINHDRVFAHSRFDEARVVVTLEVRDHEHTALILDALKGAGYHVEEIGAEPARHG